MPRAIRQARKKAYREGLKIDFKIGDVTQLEGLAVNLNSSSILAVITTFLPRQSGLTRQTLLTGLRRGDHFCSMVS